MANIPKRNSLKEKERLSSEYNDIPLMSDEDRERFPKLKYQCIYGENEKIFGKPRNPRCRRERRRRQRLHTYKKGEATPLLF